jgi:glycosyltransferase involved in cell wall biosynthesis
MITDPPFPAPGESPRQHPRRIALVCDWFLPRVGGIELHLRDLARELRRQGHHVEILTPTPGSAQVEGIPVRRLRVARAPLFGFAVSPRLVEAVEDGLQAMDADLVHTHISIVAPTGWAGGRAAVARGLPCIATFHSLPSGPVPAALALLDGLWGWRSWPVHWTGVSGVVARSVSPLLDGMGVTVLPNAVDPGEWETRPQEAPAPGGRNGGAPRPLHLVSVMRLYRRKRPEALVHIAAGVREGLPGVPFRWTVAGDGPERGRTEALARRMGVADLLHFPGFLERDRVRELLGDGDLFVLPAVLESFGIAALQARATGLPVVARREGGVGSFIRHGQDGLLASSDDEMTEGIVSLLRDPEALARMTGPRVLRHSWSRVLPLYEAARRAADELASGAVSARSPRTTQPDPTTGSR